MRIYHINPIYGNHKAEKYYQSRGVRMEFPHHVNLSCKPDVVSFGGKEKSIENVAERFRDKIKIIFSDIDGTISPHDDEVSKEVVDIFEKLHRQNIPTILTTARCYGDCIPILDVMKHKPDYTICLQGGEIADKNGNLITSSSIPQKSAKYLTDWYLNLASNIQNLHLVMYFDNLPYSLTDVQFPWKSVNKIMQVKNFDELIQSGKRFQKAVIYKPDAQSGSPLPEKIQKSFIRSGLDELEMKVLKEKFYEFQRKGITKDKAIEFLLEKQGISPKNVMVMGDSANDIEMLDYVAKRGGLSVAMGNATTEVKNHANAITSSVNENGAVKALKLLFNID